MLVSIDLVSLKIGVTNVYAIIETGSKQYRVQPGDTIDIELLDLAEGQETVEFDRVLLVGDGENIKIGTPVVTGAKVLAKNLGGLRGPKIEIVKYKRRKGYRLHTGHRQNLLRVQIDQIVA
jgi:large subunit ribosomal protein L21